MIDPFKSTSATKMAETIILTSVGPTRPESMVYFPVALYLNRVVIIAQP